MNFGFLSGVAVLVGDIVILPALLMGIRPLRLLKSVGEEALYKKDLENKKLSLPS